jgi:uracil-DNA glycosylase family 4
LGQSEHLNNETILATLEIHLEMGVDVAIRDNPSDIFEVNIMPEKKIIQPKNQILINNSMTFSENKALEFASQAKSFENLEKLFKDFDQCNLKRTATNFVRFEGSLDCKILIVDGTPEDSEDKEGKPFVNEKGELLEKMLKAIDLKRENVFLSKSIPWRPPGNRYPTNDEINICKPFIFKLIDLINPRIILCMGEVATNQILNLNKSINSSRGSWHELDVPSFYNFQEYNSTKYVLPTLNISYLLKRPETKRQAWEDMKMLREKIKEMGIK